MELEEMPSSPLKAMEAVRDDALYYIRHHVQQNWACGIYKVDLPPALVWTACFLEDESVPGTKAQKRNEKAMAELFNALEVEALTVKPVGTKRRKN